MEAGLRSRRVLWHTVLLSHGQCPHEHKATVTTLIAPSKTKTWKQEGDVENKVMSSRGREYRIAAQYVIVINRKKDEENIPNRM